MRRAGGGARDSAGEAPVDRAMQVTGKDALYLRMPRDDRGETGGIREPGPIHVFDAGHEGRMMHDHEGRAVLLRRKDAVEPIQPLLTKLAAALARDMGVKRYQP